MFWLMLKMSMNIFQIRKYERIPLLCVNSIWSIAMLIAPYNEVNIRTFTDAHRYWYRYQHPHRESSAIHFSSWSNTNVDFLIYYRFDVAILPVIMLCPIFKSARLSAVDFKVSEGFSIFLPELRLYARNDWGYKVFFFKLRSHYVILIYRKYSFLSFHIASFSIDKNADCENLFTFQHDWICISRVLLQAIIFKCTWTQYSQETNRI